MKDQHTYPNLNLTSEELATLELEDKDLRCLECGVKEVASWADQGPVAPALSPSIMSRVRKRKQQEWMGYGYKIAAGFAVLILFFQLGKNQGIVTSDDPIEATHFVVDSALNDTAFILQDDLAGDSTEEVSGIDRSLIYTSEESDSHSGSPIATPYRTFDSRVETLTTIRRSRMRHFPELFPEFQGATGRDQESQERTQRISTC